MIDFIPRSDAQRIPWLTNLKDKIAQFGPVFGLTTAEISSVQANCTTCIAKINAVAAAKTALASAVTSKNQIDKNELAQLRTLIGRWKSHTAYSDAIGETLAIKSTAAEIDLLQYKAHITAEVVGNLVRIRFTKKGADGVNIYHRRKGSAAWVFLARDTKSPYDDHIVLQTPGVPEHYEYRAFGVIDDTEIGQPSDIAEVVYGG
jgi:hypothetical protein